MEWEDYHYYYGQDTMKRQLSVTQKGLWLFAKAFWKIFIYSPLLFTGYWISMQFLERNAPALLWIGCVLGFTLLIYQLLFLLKGLLIALKQKGNLMWLLLFVICICFTCILPAYLAMEPAAYLAIKIKIDESFARMIVIVLAAYIYTRYNFHADSAPKMAAGAYRAGLNIIAG